MIKHLLIISCFLITTLNKENRVDYTESVNLEAIENKFDNRVCSFNIPADWSITEKEELDAETYYVAVEKKGENASGLVTVVSFEYLIELDDLIEINIEEIKSNSVFKDLDFTSIESSKFNNILARKTSYTFEIMGVPHRGTFFSLSSENNTVIVLFQEAIEDIASNKNGFKVLENSFKIK